MKELQCPHCGKFITVDDAAYASIVSQVKGAEFNEEIERRLEEIQARNSAEQQARQAESDRAYQVALAKRDMDLATQRGEIAKLKGELALASEKTKNEVVSAVQAKDKEIEAMKAVIKHNDDAVKIAVLEARREFETRLHDKEMEISGLKSKGETERTQAALHESELKEKYDQQMKEKNEEIALLKDMRSRLSTKMVGETLEIHCYSQFTQMLRPVMPEAYFEKDNDASEGSKGDFIFRDYVNGKEFISIMFEMKNEMDTTSTKHKNEDFFKKLDEDRKAKGCEFAVLVSLLEQDNETYNAGIVDVSNKYPKMYVVRPQFFIPIITLLDQTSRKSVKLQQELDLAKSQTVDVTNFEQRLRDFQVGFTKNFECAEKYFEKVVKDLDNAISSLTKMRDDLRTTGNQLRLANNKAAEISIKKLTRGNPTMTALFAEAAQREANIDNQGAI